MATISIPITVQIIVDDDNPAICSEDCPFIIITSPYYEPPFGCSLFKANTLRHESDAETEGYPYQLYRCDACREQGGLPKPPSVHSQDSPLPDSSSVM